MSTPAAIADQVLAKPPESSRVGLFAAALILSPLLQWLYLTVLSQFTLLEPPFTQSRGLALAMQLFFSPGSVLAVVLGVGLMRRSERMRRVARVVFLIALGVAGVQVGMQIATSRFNSNVLLAAATLIAAAAYLWYFGRSDVRQEFQAPPHPADVPDVAPGCAVNSRALIVCACVEIVLGLAAAALTFHLWNVFSGETLLGGVALSVMPPEEELLKMFLFVSFALLLSPHLLTAAAGAGIVASRDTAGMARRYSLVACWTMIGALLHTGWLVSKPELTFDVRSAKLLGAFCGFSLFWHLCFLYVLAGSRKTQ